MRRLLFVLAALAVPAAHADPVDKRPTPETFLVNHAPHGLVVLSADGREQERLAPGSGNGSLSPDGRWLASIEYDQNSARCKWILRPRRGPEEPITVPLTWDQPGHFGSQFVWASDSERLLIAENGGRVIGNSPSEYAYRIYNLSTKKLTELKLPKGTWVTGWSADGKRLLANLRDENDCHRIAWISIDGAKNAEFLTASDEFAYGARLSPDGHRILFQAGPKPPKNERSKMRLYVMELATKRRTAVDEPGETYGYCWSRDGLRVAFTWQRSLDKPEDVAVRETLLITCDQEGKKRKTVTSRTYEEPKNSSGRSAISYFFWVVEWR
jgi:Tol biopolymer transport system component